MKYVLLSASSYSALYCLQPPDEELEAIGLFYASLLWMLVYTAILNGIIAVLFWCERGMSILGKDPSTGQVPAWSYTLFAGFHFPTWLYTCVQRLRDRRVGVAVADEVLATATSAAQNKKGRARLVARRPLRSRVGPILGGHYRLDLRVPGDLPAGVERLLLACEVLGRSSANCGAARAGGRICHKAEEARQCHRALRPWARSVDDHNVCVLGEVGLVQGLGGGLPCSEEVKARRQVE